MSSKIKIVSKSDYRGSTGILIFKKNSIYEAEKIGNDEWIVNQEYVSLEYPIYSTKHIKNMFWTLEELRDKKINKLLD